MLLPSENLPDVSAPNRPLYGRKMDVQTNVLEPQELSVAQTTALRPLMGYPTKENRLTQEQLAHNGYQNPGAADEPIADIRAADTPARDLGRFVRVFADLCTQMSVTMRLIRVREDLPKLLAAKKSTSFRAAFQSATSAKADQNRHP